jgi:hypothetical protein
VIFKTLVLHRFCDGKRAEQIADRTSYREGTSGYAPAEMNTEPAYATSHHDGGSGIFRHFK